MTLKELAPLFGSQFLAYKIEKFISPLLQVSNNETSLGRSWRQVYNWDKPHSGLGGKTRWKQGLKSLDLTNLNWDRTLFINLRP